jgi:hypothetical protein
MLCICFASAALAQGKEIVAIIDAGSSGNQLFVYEVDTKNARQRQCGKKLIMQIRPNKLNMDGNDHVF